MKVYLKTTIFVFLCFQFTGSHLLYSQSNYSGYKQSNSIDIVLGGDFGFTFVRAEKTNPQGLEEMGNRRKHETFKLNSRFGFNYIHGISGNMSIKTGIRFANPGFAISSIEDFDINENINTVEKAYAYEGAEYRYNYRLVEIPLGLRIGFVKSYCEPYIELGVATNFYWQTIVEKRFNEGGKEKSEIKESLRRINYISFFSAGGNFTISNNLSGFTQLVGRYQLNNLREGALVEKIVSLGLEIGIRYYL